MTTKDKVVKEIKTKYTKCTDCGKESIVTFSDWHNDKGETLIKKKEHLCPECAKKRKIGWFNK